MSYYAELDYEQRELEQASMEDDPSYWAWLDNLEERFAIETQMWYTISSVVYNDTIEKEK